MRYFLFAFLLFQGQIFSQHIGDVFDLSYIYSPSSSDFDYQKFGFSLNYPKKLGNGVLVNSFELGNHTLVYTKDYSLELSEIENFYEVGYTVLYSYPLKRDWRVTTWFNPQMVSNLQGSLSTEDILLNGGLIFTKKWGTSKNGGSLGLGLLYTPISGRQGLLPYIVFRKAPSERLSYAIGFPNTYFRYLPNPTSDFKFGLNIHGLNANLSGESSPIFNDTQAGKLQFVNFNVKLSYSRFVFKALKMQLSAGHSLFNRYALADSDQSEIFDFDIGNRPFFSFGISYDLRDFLGKKIKQVDN